MMSVDRFYSDIRLALRALGPTEITRLGIEHLRPYRILQSRWLTPATVREYDAHDFDFLPDEELQRLSEAVMGFREVAARVNGSGPATEDQLNEAIAQLSAIVGILQPEHYFTGEAFKVAKIVEGVRQSLRDADMTGIETIEVSIDDDSTEEGHLSLLIWLVEDHSSRRASADPDPRTIRRAFEVALRRHGITRGLSIGFFHTPSEHPNDVRVIHVAP